MNGTFLNYFRCNMKFDKPIIHSMVYEDDKKLKSLRDKFSNFTFLRSRNVIYFWSYEKDYELNNPLDFSCSVLITPGEYPYIISRMLEDILLKIFRSEYINIKRNNYTNTWEILGNKSLIVDDGIIINRCIMFNTYYSKFKNNIVFGFTLAAGLRHRFIWNRNEFISNGISHLDLNGSNDVIFANKVAIKRYVEARGIKSQYDKIIFDENTYSKEYEVINKTRNWLIKKINCDFFKGITISNFENSYFSCPIQNNMNYVIIPKPKRFFANDVVGGTGKYNELLHKLKPYTYMNFPPSKPIKIVAIIPNTYEGTANNFLAKLKEELNYTFHISDIRIDSKIANGTTLIDYETVIYERMFREIDIAIIFVSETQINLPINESPYFFCKAKYIGQAIPTQEIQIEKIRKNNLSYIVNNVALNIYAKLGGTPWGIEKTRHLHEEFVIGIGSTFDKYKKMVMGIANIFDSSGKYFVGECIPLSGFDDYCNLLENSIYKQLIRLIKTHSEEVRIIFHIFKLPSNKYEIKALENIIKRIKGINIKYAFVHLGYGHNFRLYSNNGKGNLKKGFYTQISENESLINFVDEGTIPLKVTVDRRSNFNDIYYLSQQIYWFSHLSCRSYLPAKKTVTITYPSLMAKITEKLKEINGWDYKLLTEIGDKLWFL